jgi:ABC-type nickel/cobalt efflux system permease component RcnA
MIRRARRALLVCIALLAIAAPAPAHPLGNFSISHYTRLELRPDSIELRYVVDMAEIPTFQETQETGLVTEIAHPTAARYVARKAETLKDGLALSVNGRRLPLETVATTIIFPPGAGGLPTLKLAARYRARLAPGDTDLDIDYRDGNFGGRAGWKEIVAVAAPALELVHSSVPAHDRSRELSDYPTDLLDSPPQTTSATLVATRRGTILAAAPIPPPAPSDGATPALVPNRQAATRGGFTELVATRELGLGIVLFALIAASGLGALHALEPGHGKTLVAAYLVGSRGTAWHAAVLGLVVTASHTIGVYILGAVTLYASRHILPERLYPWLGVTSGLLIAGLGFVLFLRRYAGGGSAHQHTHDHGDHTHGDEHPHHHHHHTHAGEVSLRTLFALGITGGIIPCPAALVVLLSAISLNRVAFGLVLIVAFSLGLAAVLVAVGVLIVHARSLMMRWHGDGPLLTRWLPLTSSAVMTVLGVAIVVQGLRAAGVLVIRAL